ncbi:MAG: ParB N-terminal domain-containing protein [Planctomycetales bacterium]|nr:ParB N-terminal domain-containing protein [Planctomycetales bacterium]
MSEPTPLVDGCDLPIVTLVPRQQREITQREYQRMLASIRAVGLIEPLVVYPENGHNVILDGYQRYKILLELGVERVPCILWKEKESFTGNRMVNRLSPAQEMRMLRKSLEELDEKTIGAAFGITSIGHRLNQSLLRQLHPDVVRAFEAGKILTNVARELRYVKPERQTEILELMESCNDFSVPFVRGLILKTPAGKRAKLPPNGFSPWEKTERKSIDLLKRLQEVEEKQEFYAGLYRQYSYNLLKLIIFVRSLLAHDETHDQLVAHHPDVAATFREIVESSEE